MQRNEPLRLLSCRDVSVPFCHLSQPVACPKLEASASARSGRQVLACQAYGLSVPMASFELSAYSHRRLCQQVMTETKSECTLTMPEVSMLAAKYGSRELSRCLMPLSEERQQPRFCTRCAHPAARGIFIVRSKVCMREEMVFKALSTLPHTMLARFRKGLQACSR